ncbi:hypothetical protein ACFL1U_00660 [Patescibacteria group bacterium]
MNNQKTPLITRRQPLNWRLWTLVIAAVVVIAVIIFLVIFKDRTSVTPQDELIKAYENENNAIYQPQDVVKVAYFEGEDLFWSENYFALDSYIPFLINESIIRISASLALPIVNEVEIGNAHYFIQKTDKDIDIIFNQLRDQVDKIGWKIVDEVKFFDKNYAVINAEIENFDAVLNIVLYFNPEYNALLIKTEFSFGRFELANAPNFQDIQQTEEF